MDRKIEPVIRKVGLHNFKSVATAEVELGPLTLLVGGNSSGKSSILQVLRLLQQSLLSGSVDAGGPSDDIKLKRMGTFPLNDDFIRVGKIDVIRLSKDSDVNVSFEVEMAGFSFKEKEVDIAGLRHPFDDTTTIKWGIDIGEIVKDEPGSTYIQGLSITWSSSDSEQKPQLSLKVKRKGASKLVRMHYQVRNRTPGKGKYWFYREQADIAFSGKIESCKPSAVSSESSDVFGLNLERSLPKFVTVKKSAQEVLTELWLDWAIAKARRELHKSDKFPNKEDAFSGVDPLVNRVVSDISELLKNTEGSEVVNASFCDFENLKIPMLEQDLLQEVDSRREEIIGKISSQLKIGSKQIYVAEEGIAHHPDHFFRRSSLFENTATFIKDRISRIIYLGPLREEPRFLILPSTSKGIGSKGENTAAVLHLLRDQKRKFPVPSDDKNNYDSKDNIKLVDAVKAWSQYLGLVEDIDISDRAAFGFTIFVRPHKGSPKLSLPSVGVGVSQLLPVLVVCLLAEPGSVILLEQPELHLHPALQQRLADFFIAISRSGVQLIMETHSEYIISRLRLRIAEAADDELMNLVKVIFAEQGKTGKTKGKTKYIPLDFNTYGDLEKWPPEFFDQAIEDEREIIKAAFKKWEARKSSDLSEGG